jgi:DNA primase
MIKRYTQDVVFCYDTDAAGQAAVLRGFEPLVQAGLNIKVLVMPDAKDPDEYLTKHPKEDLEALIEKAPGFFRWWARTLKTKIQGLPVEEKTRALQAFVPMILQIPDEVSVQAACSGIESELSLDNRDLLNIVNVERKRGPRGPVAPKPEGNEGKDALKAGVADSQMEADFLALLTEQNGEFVPWAVNELSPEVFQREDFRKYFERLSADEMKPEELNQVPDLASSFLSIENRSEPKHREAMLNDLASALKKRHLRRQMAELKARQAAAEKDGLTDTALRVAQEMVVLKRQFEQEGGNL